MHRCLDVDFTYLAEGPVHVKPGCCSLYYYYDKEENLCTYSGTYFRAS